MRTETFWQSIKRKTKSFVKPRLSKNDFETGKTKLPISRQINQYYFDDHFPDFPSSACGVIDTGRTQWTAFWNKYGECFSTGDRMPFWDIIPHQQSKWDSMLIGGACGILLILTLLILGLTT